jgi:hypothetical protein
MKMKFKDVPIGSKFKYISPKIKGVWVKLNEGKLNAGLGLVCLLDVKPMGSISHFCFVNKEMGVDLNTQVFVI